MADDKFIRGIPGAMRSMSWNKSAELLEKWFNGPPAQAPNFSQPPFSLTMDWVLKFSRVQDAIDNSIKSLALVDKNPLYWAALDRLGLSGLSGKENDKKRDALRSPGVRRFGVLDKSGVQANATRVGERIKMGNHVWQKVFLDDLDGSLGAYGISMAVAGTVTTLIQVPGMPSMGHVIEVDTLGFYIIDDFEFEGDQNLGVWTILPDGTGHFAGAGFLPTLSFGGMNQKVFNEDFRRYRKTNSKGGDFQVVTDVKTYPYKMKFNSIEVLATTRPDFGD